LTAGKNLVGFRVAVKETDLFVHAVKPLEDITRELILKHRGVVEAYIKTYPEFCNHVDAVAGQRPGAHYHKPHGISG